MGLRIDQSKVLANIQQSDTSRKDVASVSAGHASIGRRHKDIRKQADRFGEQQDTVAGLRGVGEPAVAAQARVVGRQLAMQTLELGDHTLARYQAFLSSQLRNAAPSDAQVDALLAIVGPSISPMEADLVHGQESRATPEQKKLIAEYLEKAFAAQKTSSNRRVGAGYFATNLALMGGSTTAGALLDSLVSSSYGLPVGMAASFEFLGKLFSPQRLTADAAGVGFNRVESKVVDNDLLLLLDRAERIKGRSLTPDEAAFEANVVDQLLAMRASLDPSGAGAEIVDAFRRYAAALRGGDPSEAFAALNGVNTGAIEALPPLPLPPTVDTQTLADAKEVLLYFQTRQAAMAENPQLATTVYYLIARAGNAEGTMQPFSRGEMEVLKRRAGADPSPTELLLLWPLHQQGLLDVYDIWPGKLAPTDRMTSLVDLTLNIEKTIPALKQGRLSKLAEDSPKFVGFVAAPLSALFVPLQFLALPVVVGGRIGLGLGASALSNKVITERLSHGVDQLEGDGKWNGYSDWLQSVGNSSDLFAGSKEAVSERLMLSAEALRTELAIFDYWAGDTPVAGQPEVSARKIIDSLRDLPALIDRLAASDGTPEQLREQFLASPAYQNVIFNPEVANAAFLDLVRTFADPEQLHTPVERYFDSKLTFAGAASELAKTTTGEAGSVDAQPLMAAAQGLAQAYKGLPRERFLGIPIPGAGRTLDEDSVDRVAEQIADGAPSVALKTLQGVAGEQPAIQSQRNRVSVISEKRAGEIAQETLDAIWTQVYPFFGLVTDQQRRNPPQIQQPQVERLEAPGQRTSFRVSGALDSGGRLSVIVDGLGRPDTSRADFFKLELGEDTLQELAANVLALRAKDTDSALWLGPLKSSAPGTKSFLFDIDGAKWEVAMTASGYATAVKPWAPTDM